MIEPTRDNASKLAYQMVRTKMSSEQIKDSAIHFLTWEYSRMSKEVFKSEWEYAFDGTVSPEEAPDPPQL